MAYSPTKRERLRTLHAELRNERSTWDSHWRDLADHILPRRARFNVWDANRGEKRNQKIIDSTATFAARTLSSGMMSGVTSPARPWFRLTTPDEQLAEFGAVKVWLDDVRERMTTVFLRSNLYNKLPILYGDLGVFSTGVMSVLEDDETVIRCYDHPVGSYYLANDDKLRVRTFLREFQMTVEQIVEQFGGGGRRGEPDWTHISDTVRSLWERGQGQARMNIVHAVTPNAEADPKRLASRYKPFSSCYYEWGQIGGTGAALQQDSASTDFLAEEGFDDFPVLAARWETVGEDVYGTNGPGMIALGDIRQLQLGEKRGFQGLEKMINPPLFAPPEMRQAKISLLPGDVTYGVDPTGKGFRATHQVNFDLSHLEEKQQQCRGRIERAFFADLFLMLAYSDGMRGTQPVTAREIQERHEEKLLALGPVLEQLNQGVFDPLITRTYGIMDRRGMIPPPPAELENVPIKIEYISIMAQAQKLVGVSGIERFSSFVGQLAAVDPSVLDKVDRDQMVDEYADMTGVPPRLVVPDDQVAKVRQARAKAKQQQDQAEAVAKLAPAAQTLSQTNISQPSALTALLGSGIGRPVGAGA